MDSNVDLQWSSLPSMTTKRLYCAAAVAQDKIFVVGGHDDQNYLSSCEVYEIKSKKWLSLPFMTHKRYGCAAAVAEEKVFVVGGYDGKNYLSSCEVYNQKSKKWSPLPSMTTKRFGCAAAVAKGNLFVVGGHDGKNCLWSCEVYSLQSKKWSFVPSMTTKRNWCAAAVLEEKLFVVGGWDAKTRHSSCEVYDQKCQKWSQFSSMTTKRVGCALTAAKGKLFVVGGYDGKKRLSLCEVYDQKCQKWSSLSSMNTKRSGCAAVVQGEKLIVMGGNDGKNGLSSCEVFPIAKLENFYTKLLENDGRDIHFKISELIPMVDDVHQVKFFYTLVTSSYRLGYLEKNEYGQYIKSVLKQVAGSTRCRDEVAIFKLVLDKAEEDGLIDKFTKNILDQESEVTHISNAPFVKDLWEHVHANTARIQGLEKRVEGLEARTERLEAACKDFHLCLVKLHKGIIFKHKVEAATGMMSAVLNAISFGVVGSAASGAMKLAINSIVDFGDVSHIQDVVKNIGDVTVHNALDHALATADKFGSQRLYQQAKEGKANLKGKLHAELIAASNDGNPLVSVAITARIMNNNDTRFVGTLENVINYFSQKPQVQTLQQIGSGLGLLGLGLGLGFLFGSGRLDT